MTENQAEARRMRANGARLQDIADRFGIGKTTAWRWIDDLNEDRANRESREWKAANRDRKRAQDTIYQDQHLAICPRCGNPAGRRSLKRVCYACVIAEQDARRLRTQEMWLAGRSRRDIMRTLGWSSGYACQEFHRMREAGWYMPRREPLTGRWAEPVNPDFAGVPE